METLIWVGIAVCISQSAMFSGLNLAFFSISKLQLELEMSKGNPQAFPIARLREDSNFLLATILWGNVGVNVLLTLLSGSVLAGVSAFLFSTFVITIVGEIIPQAYLSRNAMRAAALLAPMIRLYQVLLFPLAKPTALILNGWLGKEAIHYIQEDDLVSLLTLQMEKEDETRMSPIESRGMINVARLDSAMLSELGSALDPTSVLAVETANGEFALPAPRTDAYQRMLEKILQAPFKWVVLTDRLGTPRSSLNTEAFLKATVQHQDVRLEDYCREPLVFDQDCSIVDAIRTHQDLQLTHNPGAERIYLLWTENEQSKRLISNVDLIERLAAGITYTV